MFDIVKWGNRFEYFASFSHCVHRKKCKKFRISQSISRNVCIFLPKDILRKEQKCCNVAYFLLTEFRIFFASFRGRGYFRVKISYKMRFSLFKVNQIFESVLCLFSKIFKKLKF